MNLLDTIGSKQVDSNTRLKPKEYEIKETNIKIKKLVLRNEFYNVLNTPDLVNVRASQFFFLRYNNRHNHFYYLTPLYYRRTYLTES